MPITTIKGVYRDGKIELLEAPPAEAESNVEVLVTFLGPVAPSKPVKGRMIRHGIFKGSYDSTEEDFQEAKRSWLKHLEDEV